MLSKNKHSGDRIRNFWPLTMLNIEVKILTMTITNRFQAVLDHLITLEQRICCEREGSPR